MNNNNKGMLKQGYEINMVFNFTNLEPTTTFLAYEK
jgi:hypothetical protein